MTFIASEFCLEVLKLNYFYNFIAVDKANIGTYRFDLQRYNNNNSYSYIRILFSNICFR